MPHSTRKPVVGVSPNTREGEATAEPRCFKSAQQERHSPSTVGRQTIHFPFRLVQEMLPDDRLLLCTFDWSGRMA